MRIAFYINRLNSHQAAIADALYSLTSRNLYFFELCRPSEQAKKGSTVDYSQREYLIQVWKNSACKMQALKMCIEADIAIFGAESLEYEVYRSRYSDKISFELSERWFKRGLINILSPRLLKYQWYYHILFYKKPVYKLCAGAYSASDQYIMHSFRGKCFKWGYFPDISPIQERIKPIEKSKSKVLNIMWCARMLKLKQPGLVIRLAQKLNAAHTDFNIDMYGDGPEFTAIQDKVRRLSLTEEVHLHGARPNNEIIEQMRKHDIFLFTSDRHEGWGAVVNEAMACGCAVISSNEAGCTSYLIKHRINGCVFKSNSIDSLVSEVMWMYNHPNLLEVQNAAISTIRDYWNANSAAKALISVIDSLQNNCPIKIIEGPCSEAEII